MSKMKIKILKKLLAVLCAATMSASIVAPAGAVKYTNRDEVNIMTFINLKFINGSIQQSKDVLQKIEEHYLKNKELDDLEKVPYISLIYSIKDNLQRLDKQNVGSPSFLTDVLLPGIHEIFTLIDRMQKDVNDGKDDCLESYANTINSNINRLLSENEIITNEAKVNKNEIITKKEKEIAMLKEEIENKKTEMIKLIESVKKQDPSFDENANMYINRSLPYLNYIDLEECYNKTKLQDASFNLDVAIKELKQLNNKLQNEANKKIVDLERILSNKNKEIKQKFVDAYQCIEHRKLYDKYKYVEDIENEFQKNYSDLNLINRDAAAMQKGINLIENTIKLLTEFIHNNSLTVVIPRGLSGLKSEAQCKAIELLRLYNQLGPNKKQVDANELTAAEAALASYRNIDFRNDMNLEKKLKTVISQLDAAIASLKKFDSGKKLAFQEWQEQAHKNINDLLQKATEEMKNKPNKTTKEYLLKNIEPLLCGKQRMGNCWLYAVRNIMNILNTSKEMNKKMLHMAQIGRTSNQEDKVIKNKGTRDVNDFDEVEKFFSKNGISEQVIKNGGTDEKEAEILDKFKINSSRVDIKLEKKNHEDLKTNINVVKTLILKHFANSEAPILINVKYDKKSFDTHNRTGSNHAMVIVGVDIDTDNVAVADSNYAGLQFYSLDYISSTICNNGYTDMPTKYISMVFPSLDDKNVFNYDNSKNSWDEFKSKLLPAISK